MHLLQPTHNDDASRTIILDNEGLLIEPYNPTSCHDDVETYLNVGRCFDSKEPSFLNSSSEWQVGAHFSYLDDSR